MKHPYGLLVDHIQQIKQPVGTNSQLAFRVHFPGGVNFSQGNIQGWNFFGGEMSGCLFSDG